MSRLPSQLLLLPASPIAPFSKKGCLRESASTSLLVGSYSNMLSMRSNSWWCSSASDSKYRWQGESRKGNKKEIKRNTETVKRKTKDTFVLFSTMHRFHVTVLLIFLPFPLPIHSSYPQGFAVFSDVFPRWGALVPVQTATIEILLLPERVQRSVWAVFNSVQVVFYVKKKRFVHMCTFITLV